jgi:hypothetical protein
MWKFWKRKPDNQYDSVRVVNLSAGSTIEGHDAVTAYFEKEKALLDEHGSTITFQLFRLDLSAATFKQSRARSLRSSASRATGCSGRIPWRW